MFKPTDNATRYLFRHPPAPLEPPDPLQHPTEAGFADPESAPLRPVPSPFVPKKVPPRPFGELLSEGGQRSIEVGHLAHEAAIQTYGVGVYYGIKSRFAKLPPKQQAAWLQKKLRGRGTPQEVQAQLQPSTCIEWAMQHMAAAYKYAGKSERWAQIEAHVQANDLRGTSLAAQLQADGWTAVFYARDLRLLIGDTPFLRHARKAIDTGRYHGIKIDAFLLDYRPLHPVRPKQDIEALKKAGFFFGIAKSGYHTFVGTQGEVSELHWRSGPHHPRAIERKRFNSPRFVWREGLLMIPPGQWPAE